MTGLSSGKRICLAVSTQYWIVTHRRTDRHRQTFIRTAAMGR